MRRRLNLFIVMGFGTLTAFTVSETSYGGSRGELEARPIKAYCSPSGDLCFGIFNRSGAVYLEIDTFARYFARYRLCVRGPSSSEICKSFPVRRRGRLWVSSVQWYRNFPSEGTGEYRVTWKRAASRLGPTLRFILPLPPNRS